MDKHHNSPIRRRRAAMGLTVRGLAAVAGIPASTIVGLEHGKNAASRASSEKLAAVFHCDAEALQAETDAYAKQARREKQKTRAKEQANRDALPAGPASLPVNMAVCLSVRQADRQAGGRLDMRLVHDRNPMKSLKGLRERAKLSIWEAAKRAGIPAYQWEGLEKGEEKPDIRTARRIASMFGTEWCWIFRQVSS